MNYPQGPMYFPGLNSVMPLVNPMVNQMMMVNPAMVNMGNMGGGRANNFRVFFCYFKKKNDKCILIQ